MGKRTLTARKRSGPTPKRKAPNAVRKTMDALEAPDTKPADDSPSSPQAMRFLIQREFAFDELEPTQEHESSLLPVPLHEAGDSDLGSHAPADNDGNSGLESAALRSGFDEAAARWRKDLSLASSPQPDVQFADD